MGGNVIGQRMEKDASDGREQPGVETIQTDASGGADAAEDPAIAAGIERLRAGLREAWQQPAFSGTTIDAEKWTAVYLPIPGDAASGLLLLARDAAADCLREAEASEAQIPIEAPDWTRDVANAARFSNAAPGEDARAAGARVAELDRLIEPNPEVSLEFQETKWQATGPAGGPEMTVAAIRANKWAAVDLALPESLDDLSLLNQASFAAMHCFEQREPPDGVAPERWEQRRAAAGERVKELGVRADKLLRSGDWPKDTRKDLLSYIDKAELVQAWQAPAFDEFTIAADPWTAVYLPIPENAGRELLEHARGWAADLAEYAVRSASNSGPFMSALGGPFVTLPKDAPDPFAAATRRIREIGAQLELANDSGEAYIRICAAAYDRHFAERAFWKWPTEPKTLTVPAPENPVQRFALESYLDDLEKATGNRPEIVFEGRQPEAAGQAPRPALYDPEWRLVGADWHMMVGNRTVAALTPVSSEICPEYSWLSAFVGGEDFPDHGWDNVDFETLDGARHDLEQWWRHMLRGEQYRPGRGAGDEAEAPAITVAVEGGAPEETGGEKDHYLRMVMGAPEEAPGVLKNKLRANYTYEDSGQCYCNHRSG
jgi:hypothetical protein